MDLEQDSLKNPETSIDHTIDLTGVNTLSYDFLIEYVMTKLPFKGLTLEQWVLQLKLPSVPDSLDDLQILKLNQISVDFCEIVYTNYGLSKAYLTAAQAAYNKKLVSAKDKIQETLGTKKLSITALEDKAKLLCLKEDQAKTISEIFTDFWKSQVDKMVSFNTRLTSLNISKHTEIKYTNNNL